MITRRIFLRNGALAVVGTTALPSFLTRAAFGAADPGTRTKRLVVIFQRGAADGLNIVVPHGEPSYYAMRPTINIPKKSVLDLDGFFGLHPAMASFEPLWKQKHLAIVHAAGSPDPTRSHFDAQDFMESGTPGVKVTDDGWLNRALHEPRRRIRRKTSPPFAPLPLARRCRAFSPAKSPAVAVNNLNDFSVGGKNPNATPMSNTFEAMYDHSVDTVLHGTGQETFDAVKTLKAADPAHYTPAANANYPKGRFGDSLKQLAQLIKANLGVQVSLRRHRRLGPPRQRRQHAGPDRKRPGRLFAIDLRLLDRPRRSGRRHGRRDHVRIRPHRPRKWQPRHRPRPRQRNVRSSAAR